MEIATIISWNLWQMDGIKLVVPFFHVIMKNPKPVQLSFFEEARESEPEACLGCKTNNPKKIIMVNDVS
ncbi:MAG: hypothetical protein L6U99_07500 [Clostridium sp.]|nr:MAG: hypothetical protein L6U99_07500 [Clostridium sp.]